MSSPIKLTDIIPIPNPSAFKLHLACANQDGVHPLNEYVEDRSTWIGWNEWRGDKNDWTRPFIFSFIDFYPLSNAYLFGGVFEVKDRLPDRYVLEEVESYSKWEGRLVCRFYRYQGLRGRAFHLEGQLDSFEVLQVLPQRYDGERFCGYESINHAFSMLRPILHNEKQDWKASLMAVKGVYLIMDTSNGKTYVGSAYAMLVFGRDSLATSTPGMDGTMNWSERSVRRGSTMPSPTSSFLFLRFSPLIRLTA